MWTNIQLPHTEALIEHLHILQNPMTINLTQWKKEQIRGSDHN